MKRVKYYWHLESYSFSLSSTVNEGKIKRNDKKLSIDLNQYSFILDRPTLQEIHFHVL